MMALIWCAALLLLGLWSAFVWGSWTLWQLMVDLPWDQARVALQDWKLPPPAGALVGRLVDPGA